MEKQTEEEKQEYEQYGNEDILQLFLSKEKRSIKGKPVKDPIVVAIPSGEFLKEITDVINT